MRGSEVIFAFTKRHAMGYKLQCFAGACWTISFLIVQLNAAAIDVSGNSTSAVLAFLTEVLPNTGKSAQDFKEKCPKLWTQSIAAFNQTAVTGILGSLEELENFCPKRQEQLKPTICQVAIGIASYVCDASLSESVKSQLKTVPDLTNLTTINGLCNALNDPKLTLKLCDTVKSHVGDNQQAKGFLDAYCKPQNEALQNWCTKNCINENNRACQIILQGLRTIVFWETMKDNSSAEDGSTIEAETTTVKPLVLSNKPQDIVSSTAVIEEIKNVSSSTVASIPTDPPIIIKTALENMTKVNPDDSKVPPNLNLQKPEETTTTTTTTAVPIINEIPNEKEDEEYSPVEKPDLDFESEDKPTPLQDNNLFEDDDDAEKGMEKVAETVQPKNSVDDSQSESEYDPVNTHFLYYFLAFVVLSVIGYLMYQRRNRLIALVVEGRSGSRDRRRSSGVSRERPTSGGYRKLVNNLEEAITSHSVKTSNVIY